MLNKISPVDYSVFALSLLVPALVALYYAFVQRQKTTDAYFLGNRKMGAVPLAFSLAASYLSATTITGESSVASFLNGYWHAPPWGSNPNILIV